MFAQPKAQNHAAFAWPRLSVRGLNAWLVALDALHRQRHDLTHLDDRMLADIGVSRGDAEVEAARPLLADSLLLLRGGN